MSMRMRKKRNFDARMEACGDLLLAKGAGGILNMKEAAESYRNLVDFPKAFGNDNPVALEIGCGKGNFACGMAALYPEVNFIAMERVPDVACLALEKAERCADIRPDNADLLIHAHYARPVDRDAPYAENQADLQAVLEALKTCPGIERMSLECSYKPDFDTAIVRARPLMEMFRNM